MQKVYLETPRLTLREIDDADFQNLMELDSDPRVTRFIRNGEPSSEEHIRSNLVLIQNYYKRYNHKLGLWAAIEKSSGEFMGWFLLRPDKKNSDNLKDLELGYRLKFKFWGKGFATETSKLLIDKAFKELDASSVFAVAMEKNTASWTVMKKVGMSFEKSFLDDQFLGPDQNAVRYQIKRPEF